MLSKKEQTEDDVFKSLKNGIFRILGLIEYGEKVKKKLLQ